MGLVNWWEILESGDPVGLEASPVLVELPARHPAAPTGVTHIPQGLRLTPTHSSDGGQVSHWRSWLLSFDDSILLRSVK